MNESFKNRQDNRHTYLFIYKENNFPFLALKSNTECPKLTESLKTEKKNLFQLKIFSSIVLLHRKISLKSSNKLCFVIR